MKVKILKKEPNRYLVRHLDTGRVTTYPRLFFERRVRMGMIKISDVVSLTSVI